VWSVGSAHGVETFAPPDGVTSITIFADHDPGYAGQAAAYSAARQLHEKGMDVEVRIPENAGDWLDVLIRESSHQKW
jgi:putative DNA primase/helicase